MSGRKCLVIGCVAIVALGVPSLILGFPAKADALVVAPTGPGILQILKAKRLDARRRPIIAQNALIKVLDETGRVVRRGYTDGNGNCTLDVPGDRRYTLRAEIGSQSWQSNPFFIRRTGATVRFSGILMK